MSFPIQHPDADNETKAVLEGFYKRALWVMLNQTGKPPGKMKGAGFNETWNGKGEIL
jgi:hypothetical protein